MRSRLLLILVITFCLSGFTSQSQVLYQNDSIATGFIFNPGSGTDGNPIIMFDDINIPNSRIGSADSIGITAIDLAIGRAPSAPAVTVYIYITGVDPADDSTGLAIPPIFIDSVNLPAGGPSTLIPLGDSINPFIIIPTDTSNFYSGFQTFFIGLSFSNDSTTNGWFFTEGPDANDDIVVLYDSLNTEVPKILTYFGGPPDNPPATFYAVVYGKLILANPTPVTLKDFNVTKRSNHENLITWNTETENNSSHFIIEHSKDGRKFESIGQIAAAGTSTTLRKYQFTDPAPSKGTNFYRLNSLDKDKKGKLSLIKSVRNWGETLVNVYPNPVTNIIRADVDAETAGKGLVSIFDLSGKQVYSRQVEIKEGVNPLTFNISGVVRGNYVMKIRLNDKDVIVKQFTKQ